MRLISILPILATILLTAGCEYFDWLWTNYDSAVLVADTPLEPIPGGWSSDGNIVLAVQEVEDSFSEQLVAVGTDVGGLRTIPMNVDFATIDSACFSLDGLEIVFSANPLAGGSAGIYTVPITGGTPQLVPVSAPSSYPTWAHESNLIAYCNSLGLWIYDMDTSASRQLVSGMAMYPTFSPDDSRIAYINFVYVGEDTFERQLWVVEVDDADDNYCISPAGWNCLYPCWRPDEDDIAFSGLEVGWGEESKFDIYLIDSEGQSVPEKLTDEVVYFGKHGPAGGLCPMWSPDGEWITFYSDRQIEGQSYFRLWKIMP